jgi:inner membrane transporter RhtA
VSGTNRVPAWSLLILSITSVQLGSALATGLFPEIGPAGTAWLRFSAGAVFFLALRRPRLRGRTRGELASALALGAITGAMTVCFLSAIDRLPLGTTVAIEFLGPLVVAVLGTRSVARLGWPILAFAGVLLVTEPWVGSVDPVGIVFAVGAGVGWGSYILLTARVGDQFAGLEGLSITIPIAAVTSALVGVPQALGHVTPAIVLAAIGLAVLQPLLPFSLELIALRRLTTATFGTLMALEPAVGMAIGALVLAQVPTAYQAIGVALVVLAGIGVTRGSEGPANVAELVAP